MIAFLVDQNFDEHIVDGLTPPSILPWSLPMFATLGWRDCPIRQFWNGLPHGLVVLTHDRKTIPPLAYVRVAAGLAMPGVFLVSGEMPIGKAIEELLVAIYCLSAEECKNIVTCFPL